MESEGRRHGRPRRVGQPENPDRGHVSPADQSQEQEVNRDDQVTLTLNRMTDLLEGVVNQPSSGVGPTHQYKDPEVGEDSVRT